MKTDATTLLVIGGGPGGYVAAIRAGQLGIPTVLVEGERVGGTCLNVGCIPSKALIHAADEFERACRHAGDSPLGIRASAPTIDLPTLVGWKDGIVTRLTGGVAALLKKSGVRVVHGRAQIVDGKTVDIATVDGATLRIGCAHLLLATGSLPVALPQLPFGGPVVSSTEALAPVALPRRLVVVGAGYIGLELGTVYRKLGCGVAVVEMLPRVLPAYDAELTRPVAASLRRLGIVVHLECAVDGWNAAGDALRVRRGDGTEFEQPADRVLVAVGRRPASSGYGLESLRLEMAGAAVRVDAQCRTSMRDVWAIGDLTGEPMLAHRAMAQGEMVAEIIGGARRRFVPAAIPAVCYTDPEVVVAGIGPADGARQEELVSAQFPLAANGRALTLESPDGFIRVVARRDDHRIVGWQAVGRGVAELAAAFGQSLEMGAVLEDVAHTIHAHPTLGEAVQEAALRALGRALHV
jgi:dihydrolipoamide dehydrogenase